MSMGETGDRKKSKWPRFLLVLALETSQFLIAYTIYAEAVRDDELASNSGLVCMKVTGRERGVGTLKYPDHIYTEYQGKKHDFACGRKYFRKMMTVDSIEGHFDPASGEAALPGSGG